MSVYVNQIMAGIGDAAILFLVASGLTLVFGALRIANFAHGSLFMLGAFLMFSIGNELGSSNTWFFVSMILAALCVAVIGFIMEILTFRPIYSRPLLTQLLVTFGLVLMIGGIARGIYGTAPRGISAPPVLSGSVPILEGRFPNYQLFLIGLAAAVALVLWILLHRTGLGQMIRAAVSDPELLSLSGVNVTWLFTGVFVIGAFFAGLAGAVAAQGAVGVGIDIQVILKAFVVIVIGGMGSLAGALVGSLLVGIAGSLGILWIPNASLVVVFAVLVLVLAVRPTGLFGEVERRDALRPVSVQLPRIPLGRLRFALASVSRPSVDAGMWLLAGVAIVIAGVLPWLFSTATVLIGVFALIFGLFALSLNLLVGTSGLMSFGQAAYFGIGAYAVALLVLRQGWSPMAALALTPAIGAAGALIGGVIALRASELYFALLTLGVAQIAYAVAIGYSDFTGGSDGLHGNFTPDWLIDLNNLYWFVFGVVLLCAALLFVLTRSPFGDTLRGIRENRRRAEFTGIWLKRYELTAFVIAGAFSAVAGGLFAVAQGQAYPDLLFWTTSALPMISALLGGIGLFLGPIVGAFFYTFLNDHLAQRTAYWDTAVGVSVLFVALVMPGGLTGAFRWLISMGVSLAEHVTAVLRPVPTEPPNVVRPEEKPQAVHRPPIVIADRASPASPRATIEGAPPIFEAEHLWKSFGGLHAVRDVTLQVRQGSIHAVIGPNGAGKTTLFNLMTGLVSPDRGKVTFEGKDVTNVSAWRLVRRGFGRAFQQPNLFWALSCLSNVVLPTAAAHGVTARVYGTMPSQVREKAAKILDLVSLSSLATVPASELSHGDQRSLEIAAAIAVESKLLFLDEPTAGMSQQETRVAVEMIKEIVHKQNLTVLLIEHDMEVVFRAADRITVLHEGATLAEGIPEEIRQNPEIQKAYLGESESRAQSL